MLYWSGLAKRGRKVVRGAYLRAKNRTGIAAGGSRAEPVEPLVWVTRKT